MPRRFFIWGNDGRGGRPQGSPLRKNPALPKDDSSPAPTAGHTGPALQNNVMYGDTINNPSVGADTYIGPPSYAPHLQGGQSRPPLQRIQQGRPSRSPAPPGERIATTSDIGHWIRNDRFFARAATDGRRRGEGKIFHSLHKLFTHLCLIYGIL